MPSPERLDQQLRLIDDSLDHALTLADGVGEHLVAALISAARDAVVKRYSELGDRPAL